MALQGQLWVAALGLSLAVGLVGCNAEQPEPVEETAAPSPSEETVAADPADAELSDEERQEIAAALAKLSPEDRAAAEKQKFCLVNEGGRLGSMGPPVKVQLDEDTTVFLCCEGCEPALMEDKEKFLAKLESAVKDEPQAK